MGIEKIDLICGLILKLSSIVGFIYALVKWTIFSFKLLEGREFKFLKTTIIIVPSKSWEAFKNVSPVISAHIIGKNNKK